MFFSPIAVKCLWIFKKRHLRVYPWVDQVVVTHDISLISMKLNQKKVLTWKLILPKYDIFWLFQGGVRLPPLVSAGEGLNFHSKIIPTSHISLSLHLQSIQFLLHLRNKWSFSSLQERLQSRDYNTCQLGSVNQYTVTQLICVKSKTQIFDLKYLEWETLCKPQNTFLC